MSSIKETYWNFIESEDYQKYYLSDSSDVSESYYNTAKKPSKQQDSTLGTPKQFESFKTKVYKVYKV